MTKAVPEFTCLWIYQWSKERGQNILDKATFVEADLKKWEEHLEKLEEHCKPRGSRFVEATQYKVLTQGDMELLEYIEKSRQITDACGWPEEAKDMALRNAIPARGSDSKEHDVNVLRLLQTARMNGIKFNTKKL